MPASHDPSSGHSHDHSHEHGHHHHVPTTGKNIERRLIAAFLLTAGFMGVEVIGGYLSGSLALIADAGHMLTDAGALMLAILAMRIAKRPADANRSYGYERAETLAAFVNAIAMIALAIWICIEAAFRLFEPVEVLGGLMMWVAVGGLLVNIASFTLLHAGAEENLNIKGAAIHVLGDLLGSVAAIAAAIIILTTGWMMVDPLLSVLVALLILRSAISLARQSGNILMESTPPELDLKHIENSVMEEVEGLENVHHLHAWSLTSNRALMTLHARLKEDADPEITLHAIEKHLRVSFNITHTTIQLEQDECPGGTSKC